MGTTRAPSPPSLPTSQPSALSTMAFALSSNVSTFARGAALSPAKTSAKSSRAVAALPAQAALSLPGLGPKKEKKASKASKKGGKFDDVKAQSFKLSVPGGLLQSSNNLEKTVTLGFSKSNELFVGRVAMLGFASSVIGELLTGKGAMGQFGLETGIPLSDTEPLILAVVGFNLLAAFGGALGFSKGVFVPDAEEYTERPAGALQDANISITQPGKFFGIEGVGFTKLNELFVGRVAMLGMAASLVGEAITGQGPLAQFDFETGIPLQDTDSLLAASIIFFLFTAINPGSGKFVDEQ